MKEFRNPQNVHQPLGSYSHQIEITWNERMLVETVLSLVTMVCHLKKVFHRTRHHFQTRLTYMAALFNSLLWLNRRLQPDADPQNRLLHLAHFAL